MLAGVGNAQVAAAILGYPTASDIGQRPSTARAAAAEAIGTGCCAVMSGLAGAALGAKLLSTIRTVAALKALVSVSSAGPVAPYALLPLFNPPVITMMATRQVMLAVAVPDIRVI